MRAKRVEVEAVKKNWRLFLLIILLAFSFKWCHENLVQDANARPAVKPKVRAKFYDFSDQLIDGEVRRPTALYTDSRQEVKFKRLLRLKRSFDRELHNSSRMSVFK